ncbi:hypothetical protein HY523_01585 [Candidatus Berkelbacteria bacterium]|nr:hypothetical protein [Candidatus Berkelbacteria bacterium]
MLAVAQSLMVAVADWQNPREVVVGTDGIAMEVAFNNHCPTCVTRVQHVMTVLRGTSFTTAQVRGSLFIALPYAATAPRDPESIAQFLSEKLVLPVRVV